MSIEFGGGGGDSGGVTSRNATVLSRAASQTIDGADTFTPVKWDTEEKDEGGWYDHIAKNGKIYPGAIEVDIVATVRVNGATSKAVIKIERYNSSDVAQETLSYAMLAISVNDASGIVSALECSFAATDYFRVEFSGSAAGTTIGTALTRLAVRESP